MVFPDSWLRVDHVSGCGLVFCALDALRKVDTAADSLKVAAADDWRQSRCVPLDHVSQTTPPFSRGESLAKAKGVVQPFDWTFTTDYSGTLVSHQNASIQV